MPDALNTVISFHDALFAERERVGLTQTQLANALGTSQQNVASWESGRSVPRARTLARLVEYFGPNSPIARLAPKGRLEPSVPVRLVSTSPGEPDVVQDLRTIWRNTAGDNPTRHPPDLRKHLAERLQGFVEHPIRLGNRTARADYWSPALGLEFFQVSANSPPLSILQRARAAMQQLLVWNRIDPGSRKLALVIVVEDAASILQGSLLERMTTESSVLGIEVVYTSAIHGVVNVIEQTEDGKSIDFDDD